MQSESYVYEMPDDARESYLDWFREEIANASAELETKAAKYVVMAYAFPHWKITAGAVRLINECDMLANKIRAYESFREQLRANLSK